MTNKLKALAISCPRELAFPPPTNNQYRFSDGNSSPGSKPNRSAMMSMVSSIHYGKSFLTSDSKDVARALSRFGKLPIHKICYQHHCNSSEYVLRKLRRTTISPSRSINPWRIPRLCNLSSTIISGRQQDLFGMTPLHILATSTKHDLELYQLIIENYPENLIAEDVWGDIPLMYAIWNDVPMEILQLLAQSHKTLYPRHEIDWVQMIETIGRAQYKTGRANASLECIQNLLRIQQDVFPNNKINWQQIITKWASIDFRQRRNSERFHQDTFKYLVKFSIEERIKTIWSKKWRQQILNEFETLHWYVHYRVESTKVIYTKLEHYEHLSKLKEAASLLELALWKTSIDSLSDGKDLENASEKCTDEDREVCRIQCGADVVVPNVIAFL